jgi:ATP-dependent Clp endopeptidase proteolytic subunit ClpP
MKIMPRFWNFIKNEQDDTEVELRISGEVVSDDDAWIYEWFGIPAASPNSFRAELSEHKGKNITVWIDSYGGDVFAGAGIYNALKEHNGKVTVKIDGKAMSAASVIAMAGDEINISPVGMLMIHNPWSSAVGEAKDMRHAADVLDEVKNTIINAYQLKTKKSHKKISEMMDEETFMSAKKAAKEGFVDKILYTSSDDGVDDPIENNFMFSRLSIQNSMSASMQRFMEFAKKEKTQSSAPQAGELKPQPDANINNNLEGVDLMPPKTIEELRNTCPELVRQIEDAARAEGAKNERHRIRDIEKISANINTDLVNKAKFEEPVDAKELAFKALQEDSQRGQQYLNNSQTDAQNSGANNVPAASSGESGEKPKNTQDKLKNIAAGFDALRRGGNR